MYILFIYFSQLPVHKTPINPYTRSWGTGIVRVRKTQPVPVPRGPLPVTRPGFKTLDNPYWPNIVYKLYTLIYLSSTISFFNAIQSL